MTERGTDSPIRFIREVAISVLPLPKLTPPMLHLRKTITFSVRVPVLSLKTCEITPSGWVNRVHRVHRVHRVTDTSR